jgi:hypothetical protein
MRPVEGSSLQAGALPVVVPRLFCQVGPQGAIQVSGWQGGLFGIGPRPAPGGRAPPAGPSGLRRAVAPHWSRAAVAKRGPFDSIIFYRKMTIRVVGVRVCGAQELIALSPYRRIATKTTTGQFGMCMRILRCPSLTRTPPQVSNNATLLGALVFDLCAAAVAATRVRGDRGGDQPRQNMATASAVAQLSTLNRSDLITTQQPNKTTRHVAWGARPRPVRCRSGRHQGVDTSVSSARLYIPYHDHDHQAVFCPPLLRRSARLLPSPTRPCPTCPYPCPAPCIPAHFVTRDYDPSPWPLVFDSMLCPVPPPARWTSACWPSCRPARWWRSCSSR